MVEVATTRARDFRRLGICMQDSRGRVRESRIAGPRTSSRAYCVMQRNEALVVQASIFRAHTRIMARVAGVRSRAIMFSPSLPSFFPLLSSLSHARVPCIIPFPVLFPRYIKQ